MDRVAVVGPGGAGRTTFARELGRRTGSPVVHLDHEHSGTLDVRLSRADTVVMDPGRWIRTARTA